MKNIEEHENEIDNLNDFVDEKREKIRKVQQDLEEEKSKLKITENN